MMLPALADRIILCSSYLRQASILSYALLIIVSIASYAILVLSCGVVLPSYSNLENLFPFIALSSFPINTNSNQDYVEELGGKGPPVAVYLRVSSKRQAKEGMSIEAQRDAACKMKLKFDPSRIHWFVDAGKSAKSAKDFDKLKISEILKLKEEKKIDELWAFDISRIGRECRKLLYLFLEFCDDGIIRTPDKTHTLEDLGSIITFIVDAHSAEKANKDRTVAAMASKAQFFKCHRWNKPLPFGYKKSISEQDSEYKKPTWLMKDPEKSVIVKDIFSLFLQEQNLMKVTQSINAKYVNTAPALSKYQVKRVLTDPIAIGKPSHVGVTVVDSALAIVDVSVFSKCGEIIEALGRKKRPRWSRIIKSMATEKPLLLLTLLSEKVDLQCKTCGGKVVWNGSIHDGEMEQERLYCKKCGKQFRFPTRSQLEQPRCTISSLRTIDDTNPLENQQRKIRKKKGINLKMESKGKNLSLSF